VVAIKKTGAWGRIALATQKLLGYPNINHPPGEPLLKRTVPKLSKHNGLVTAQKMGAITLASSGVQVHKGHSTESSTVMILPQVHLWKPCYDFYAVLQDCMSCLPIHIVVSTTVLRSNLSPHDNT